MAARTVVRLSRWSAITKLRRCSSSRAWTPLASGPSSDARLELFRKQPVAVWSRELSSDRKSKFVNITFIDRDGDELTVKGKIGDTLLEVAKEHDIDLEGACEGTLSCSTCHLILTPDWYEKIPDPLTEEEQDMLDLAFGLTDMSRLGCQILVSSELEGIRLKVPSGTSDARNT